MRVLGSPIGWSLVAALAAASAAGCGGETIASLDGGVPSANGGSSSGGGSGSGASGGGPGASDGGGPGASDSGSGDGTHTGGSSGGGGSSGSIPDSGAVVVPGNPFPCGSGVCAPPDICCQRIKTGPATCEPAGQCSDSIAHGCTDLTCPSGSLCCGAADADAGVFGFTECQVGAQCSSDTAQVCTQGANDCPTGDFCSLEADGLGVDFCLPMDAGSGGSEGGR